MTKPVDCPNVRCGRPKNLLASLLLCGTALTSMDSLAAIIYTDDFNRANSTQLGDSWQELEKDANDVAIYQNAMRLRDTRNMSPDAAATRSIDLSAYMNLQLSFDWRATSSTEPSDTLYVGWRKPDLSFDKLWSTGLGGSDFVSETITLNKALIVEGAALAFWIDVGNASETAYIDNLLISGDRLIADNEKNNAPTAEEPVQAVPEPASSLLLMGALSALVCRRRWRKPLRHT